MNSEPTLLTVILNYRTPDMTIRAAKAALREMQGIAGRLVIVDNNSEDGSFERIEQAVASNGWAKDDRTLIVQSGSNGGFGWGNNVGIQAGLATGDNPDYIYILNSDAFPDSGAISALVSHLQSHPNAGLAGSYIHGPDGQPHVTAFQFPTIAGEFEGAACTGIVSRLLARSIVPLPLPSRTQSVGWLAGASMMMRTAALREFGLFDPSFFLYFEETDLCMRARRAGWETHYVRESAVTHIGSVSTGMKTWTRTPGYWFKLKTAIFHKKPWPALCRDSDPGPYRRGLALSRPVLGVRQTACRSRVFPS